MGRMIDGEWHTDAELAKDDSGAFEREPTSFRDWITGSRHPDADPSGRFDPEPGRYHLYVSYACPWAHRTLLVRKLKGLEDAISVDVVSPIREDDGWEFDPEWDGATEDSQFGADYLRELYAKADSDYNGRVTVPVLWDTEEETIVNNESEEIMRMLDTAFDEYAERDVDLYPDGYEDEVDRVIQEIYDPINNGVYRAGFADTQEAYDEAVEDLFDALDEWNDVLAEQRYLAGDVLTEADIAMFTTLYRFDEVYHTHFKCNHRYVTDYEHLWNYLRELCQLKGVDDTLRMDHIKHHYYRTHPSVNPKRIVPKGPDPDFFDPHTRDELPGGPPEPLAD